METSKCIRVVLDGRYIQDHFPGIGRYTYHLAEALGKLPDVQVELLVNPTLPNTRYNLQALSGHVTLRPCPVPTFSIKEQTELPKYVKALRPDVYHSPYYIKPLIKSWIRPVPSVLTMHDVLPLRVSGSLGSRRMALLFRITAAFGLYSADRVIAVSEASREDIITLFHIPSKRINVVYEAASSAYHPYAPSDPRIAAVRKRYGLPEKFALYVGINKPHKNLVRLVQAWGKLGSGSQGWELVLAGGEDLRYKQARHEAARLGLPIHFPGSIAEADLPALYNAAGIFVLPSTYEGFGLPVLEAMACGTPVLCSNTSSLPEIAGRAALYVSPEDTDKIAEMLRGLIGDPLLRAELAEKGRHQAARFSWERAARETLAVYRFALL